MRTPRLSNLALLLIAVVWGVLMVHWRWQGTDGEGWRWVVRSDVKGYQGYLKALLITHDLGQETPDPDYLHRTPTGSLNKYFAGTSVLMLPWFTVGHGWALLTDAPRDGLSAPYQKALSLGGVVHGLLGLWLLGGLLVRMRVSDGLAAFLLLVLAFGTQLLQYAVMQPGWTHVHSFLLFTLFLRLAWGLDERSPTWRIVATGAVLGLIVLVRPTNGLVLLALPVLWGSGTAARALGLITQRPLAGCAAVLGALIMVGLQPLLWKLQTGNWWEWSYRGEGFHWGRPEVFNVLFSWWKGLFVWTPVMFVALLAAVSLVRRDPWRGIGALGYWAVVTYVISAWWIWYYGGGFGHRAFVEHYAVFVLPLGLVLQQASPAWRRSALVLLAALGTLHAFQFWQYEKNIIHPVHMDRAKYLHVFGRTAPEFRNSLGGNMQCPPFHPHGLELVLTDTLGWNDAHWQCGDPRGQECVMMQEFGAGFELPPGSLPEGRALFVEVKFERYVGDADGTRDVLGVLTVEAPDTLFHYETFRMDPLPARAGVWEPITYRMRLDPLGPGQRVKGYWWNRPGATFKLREPRLRVYAVKP